MTTENTFSNNQETMELIDRFLLEQLEQDELQQFHDRMEQDLGFRTLVLEQRQQKEAVEEYNIRKSIDSFHEEISQEKKLKRALPKWWAIAASILLLIGISLWTVINNENSAGKIYAKNFKPDPGLPTTMGQTSDYEFYTGMVSYKQKKYSEAIAQWEPLYSAAPQNDTFTYFLGVAHLADGDTEKAEKYLELSSDKKDGVFKEETDYYLALTYLKENKIKEAIKVLKSSPYPTNIKLLEEIEALK